MVMASFVSSANHHPPDLKDWIFPSTSGNLLPRPPQGKIHTSSFHFPLQPRYYFHLGGNCNSYATPNEFCTIVRPGCHTF